MYVCVRERERAREREMTSKLGREGICWSASISLQVRPREPGKTILHMRVDNAQKVCRESDQRDIQQEGGSVGVEVRNVI